MKHIKLFEEFISSNLLETTKWNSIPNELYDNTTDYLTKIGNVNISINSKNMRLRFQIGNKMDFAGYFKSMDDVNKYIDDNKEALLKVKTMNQLMKIPQYVGESVDLNESRVVLDTTEPDNKDLLDFCKKHHIKMKELNSKGPGGNIPEYEYTGSKNDLINLIDEFWEDDHLHSLVESLDLNESKEHTLTLVSKRGNSRDVKDFYDRLNDESGEWMPTKFAGSSMKVSYDGTEKEKKALLKHAYDYHVVAESVNEGMSFDEIKDKYENNPYGIGAQVVQYVHAHGSSKLIFKHDDKYRRDQIVDKLKELGVPAKKLSKSTADKAYKYRYELTMYESVDNQNMKHIKLFEEFINEGKFSKAELYALKRSEDGNFSGATPVVYIQASSYKKAKQLADEYTNGDFTKWSGFYDLSKSNIKIYESALTHSNGIAIIK